MSELLTKYGEYLIPKGTILFRQAKNKTFLNEMFFGFCTTGAGTASNKSNSIQVWKTNTEIKGLLMLRGKSSDSSYCNLYSSIIEINNSYFPLSKRKEWEDVEIKRFDNIFRRRLISLFKSQGIYSWVNSAEDNYVMELFMFAGSENNQTRFSYQGVYKYGKENLEFSNTNSFDYEKIKHLPIIKKKHAPLDPITHNMIFGS